MKRLFYRDKYKPLTDKEIKEYILTFCMQQLPRLKKLENYYKGQNESIKNRSFNDSSKPNNKIAVPYASYITDNFTSYFVGKPVTINSKREDMLKDFIEIFNYNDSQANDINLARDMSIYGYGVEIYWIDEDNQLRFTTINPKTVIPIFSNNLDEELLYCIRWYTEKNIVEKTITTHIEVYSKNKVDYYKCEGPLEGASVQFVGSSDHYFGDVPFSIYKNNDLCEGDFEKVIPLIDAYDLAISDTANSIAYFNDSYLLFTNVEDLDESKIQDMKSNRIIAINSMDGLEADCKWLTKQANDIEMENYKKRLVEEIHKQSRVINLNEDAMKSHVSAEAIRMSLLQTEQIVAIKEAKFKKGIQRRVELFTNIFNIKGKNYDYRDLSFVFNRNLPQSYANWADIVAKLRGIVSTETLLEQLPFIADVSQELERLKKEYELQPIEPEEHSHTEFDIDTQFVGSDYIE